MYWTGACLFRPPVQSEQLLMVPRRYRITEASLHIHVLICTYIRMYSMYEHTQYIHVCFHAYAHSSVCMARVIFSLVLASLLC